MTLLSLLLLPQPAHACGGMFCDAVIPVDQAAERIVFTLDGTTVVTEVQITYQGQDDDFAWIVPVPAEPELFISNDALFTRLANATVPTYTLQTDNEGGSGIGCAFAAESGMVMVAEDASQVAFLRSKMEREIKSGIEVHLIERAELRKMAPYFSDRVIAAEYCPLEGKLNPTYATPAIARAAERHGARIFRHTELLGFERDQGQFRVRTNRGLVRCRRLVNAAGPWGDIVAGMAGVSFTTTKNAIHMNATEAVEPFIPHLIEHAGRRLTMKQAINGNVLIGGGWPAEIDETTDRTWVARKSIEGSLWVAGAVVPRVGNLRLLRTWTGINVIMDGRPILGEVPGKPGFINALTSTGYTLGPISARLVAEQMTRKNLTMDIRPYSIERFSTAQTTA